MIKVINSLNILKGISGAQECLILLADLAIKKPGKCAEIIAYLTKWVKQEIAKP